MCETYDSNPEKALMSLCAGKDVSIDCLKDPEFQKMYAEGYKGNINGVKLSVCTSGQRPEIIVYSNNNLTQHKFRGPKKSSRDKKCLKSLEDIERYFTENFKISVKRTV